MVAGSRLRAPHRRRSAPPVVFHRHSWWSVAVFGWWRVWCGRLHLRVVRLMSAERAEPSGRWWRRRSRRLILPPLRSSGGRRRGGLPIYLIKVVGLGFLLGKDGDLSEAYHS
jgi:hypothetical protein